MVINLMEDIYPVMLQVVVGPREVDVMAVLTTRMHGVMGAMKAGIEAFSEIVFCLSRPAYAVMLDAAIKESRDTGIPYYGALSNTSSTSFTV